MVKGVYLLETSMPIKEDLNTFYSTNLLLLIIIHCIKVYIV